MRAHGFINLNFLRCKPFPAFVHTHTFSMNPTHCFISETPGLYLPRLNYCRSFYSFRKKADGFSFLLISSFLWMLWSAVLNPSDSLCRSRLLLLCPLVTLSSLHQESPANVQTCPATRKHHLPCRPPSGYLRGKALSCPCCHTASCPVIPASGTLRTSTSSSPLDQVGAASADTVLL